MKGIYMSTLEKTTHQFYVIFKVFIQVSLKPFHGSQNLCFIRNDLK